MDYCSFFIKNKCLFGSYPAPEQVTELESIGVRYFVNLTHSAESKITDYLVGDTSEIINFPIDDGGVPTDDIAFTRFIYGLCDIFADMDTTADGLDTKIYVHCKGGHGRSGLVVACLIAKINGVSPKLALEMTRNFHDDRLVMRMKWRQLGSPQTHKQKQFVYNACRSRVIRLGSDMHPYTNGRSCTIDEMNTLFLTPAISAELYDTKLMYIYFDGVQSRFGDTLSLVAEKVKRSLFKF